MKTEKGMLAINRLLFELTVADGAVRDLNVLLEKLFSTLESYPGISPEPRGAIMLMNPRGKYFPVAQLGLEPGPIGHDKWQGETAFCPPPPDRCQIRDIVPVGGNNDGSPTCSRVLMLPLHSESQNLGYAAMFVSPSCKPEIAQTEFVETLAKTLSASIQRILIWETLSIRELELEEARADALHKLGVASEYRDNETGWHIMRMSNYAISIAKKMDVPSAVRELLYVAAPMHDLGKIGIPDSLLLKPGKLSKDEFDIM